MRAYLLATVLIFLLLLAWIGVQGLYRRFAQRHPQLGPYREDVCCGCASGCAGSCGGATHHHEPRAPCAGMLNSQGFTRP